MSRKIVDYSFIVSRHSVEKMLTSTRLKSFTDEVKIAMSNGWQPFGEINTLEFDGMFLIMQVIVKYEDS